MKFKIHTIYRRKIRFIGCAVLIITAFGAGAAQTKRKTVAVDDKPFSVPCAKALRIGLSAVENLYMKDMDRRTRGETDSDTEGEAMENALKNYIPCRRADNAAKLKTFTAADKKAEVKRQEAAAKQLARQRFDGLIFGISWNEKGDDLFDYQMTLRALALVEDYKGALIKSYSMDVKPKTNAAKTQARRNEKLIREMLIRLETSYIVDAENAQTHKNKFAEFKVTVNRFLQENSDRVDTEKAITANFIVNLIKLGSWKN
jgi:hypothetical protein